MTSGARFESAFVAVDFILSGKARVTLVSAKTGARFTYRINVSKDGRRWYVGVLTGPDNHQDYTFLGTIFPAAPLAGEGLRYAPSPRGLSSDSPSAKAWGWAWANMAGESRIPEDLEVWHEGQCGRCGRLLTTPESIARGLGPECCKARNHR